MRCCPRSNGAAAHNIQAGAAQWASATRLRPNPTAVDVSTRVEGWRGHNPPLGAVRFEGWPALGPSPQARCPINPSASQPRIKGPSRIASGMAGHPAPVYQRTRRPNDCQQLTWLFTRIGLTAKLPLPAHPHMLRHACGFKLANEGHDTRSLQHYLGHNNIARTVRYTELTADRFKSFWRD